MKTEDLAFDLNVEQPTPSAYIQWKGTDICMDFHCDCGADHHIDGMFVYAVKCHECGTVWEMPKHLYPRKLTSSARECVFITTPSE